MRKKIKKELHFFVDEAGDPVFFNRKGQLIVGQEGCSKTLLLGFVMTEDPKALRKSLLSLHKDVINDPYLQDIPSIQKTKVGFHAKDDCPEVREKVYKRIKEMDFTAEFIIARKLEKTFRNRHKSKTTIFYDDLVTKLFKNKLHLAEKNYITYASRGNRKREEPFSDALQVAINDFEKQWKTKVDSEYKVEAHRPSGEPCLQVVDYMNWAVQRAFERGEMRYFNYVKEKVKFLVDIYDFDKYPTNFYNSKNQFDITKMSPL